MRLRLIPPRGAARARLRAARAEWSEFFAAPGARTFLTVWSGQVVSLLGSGISSFALGIWIYQRTGSVTLFSLALVCAVVPGIVLPPFAGWWWTAPTGGW